MKGALVLVDPEAPDAIVIARAVDVLLSAGLVAFPTETVYGLGACALDEAAVEKIFAAKGRPAGHPLIVHVNGQKDARELSASWTPDAEALANVFWPGPLTLVVAKGASVPLAVTGGGDSVALRATAHPVARALIAGAGPLAAPSANRYQSLSPTQAAHVAKSLGDRVDLILDGGAAWAGIESTVVDVRESPPRVLRHGAVGIAELRIICPNVTDGTTAESADHADAVHVSPGQDAKHYAPNAELVIAASRAEAIGEAHASVERGDATGLIVRGDATADLAFHALLQVASLPDDAARYAQSLFATLHLMDDRGCKAIVIEAVPAGDAWRAVADRLQRASTR